jgi:hypothetical protein
MSFKTQYGAEVGDIYMSEVIGPMPQIAPKKLSGRGLRGHVAICQSVLPKTDKTLVRNART